MCLIGEGGADAPAVPGAPATAATASAMTRAPVAQLTRPARRLPRAFTSMGLRSGLAAPGVTAPAGGRPEHRNGLPSGGKSLHHADGRVALAAAAARQSPSRAM